MSYTWEPKWEKIKISSDGIEFWTCRDRITGMIACPICANVRSACFGGVAEGAGKAEPVFFFTAEDLIWHLRDFHARSSFRPKGERRGARGSG